MQGDSDVTEADNTTIQHVDWAAVDPAVAVVETVSDATGRDPTELPTLHDALDSDALNDLCVDDTRDTDPVTLSFVYADHDVTVIGNGTIIVEPIADEE